MSTHCKQSLISIFASIAMVVASIKEIRSQSLSQKEIPNEAFSQKTLIDFSAGVSFDLISRIDADKNIYTLPIPTVPIICFGLEHKFRNRHTIELGYSAKRYSSGFGLKNYGFLRSNSINTDQYQFRWKFAFFERQNFRLNYLLGGTYCINKSYNSTAWGTGKSYGIKDTIIIEHNSIRNIQKKFTLVETGFDIEYSLNSIILSGGMSCFSGNKAVERRNIAYKYNSNPYQHSTVISNGSYILFRIGLKYLIHQPFKPTVENGRI